MKKLDFLSYSYYPPACEPNEEPLDAAYNPGAKNNPSKTVEQMMSYLKSRQTRIASICECFDNMPIAFTEYGVRSAHGCIMQPYNFQWETYYDGQEQADYMEASFKTFGNFLSGWDFSGGNGMKLRTVHSIRGIRMEIRALQFRENQQKML